MNPPNTAPPAARSRSASAQTIIGSLPPSSSVHGNSRRAQASAIFLPVPTLPVKQILSTPLSTSAAPLSASPSTTSSTSLGSPAASNNSSTSRPENGVTSDGLSTTALPAINA